MSHQEPDDVQHLQTELAASQQENQRLQAELAACREETARLEAELRRTRDAHAAALKLVEVERHLRQDNLERPPGN